MVAANSDSVALMQESAETGQGQLFYSFCLDETVTDDHPMRAIASVLDLSWVHGELAPYYPKLGRPSIDPAPAAPQAFARRFPFIRQQQSIELVSPGGQSSEAVARLARSGTRSPPIGSPSARPSATLSAHGRSV
jgi:hypothetical protein